MQICCSICKEIFIHHSEVVVTECGHLYHNLCVFEWLKNQSTCPQCRTSVKKNKVHRVYFDVENDTDVDPSSLQHKIDKLLYDVQVKDSEIRKLNDKLEELGGSNKLLRELVRKSEEDIQSYKELNRVLKSEIRNSQKEIDSYKQQKFDYDLLRNKVTTLLKVEELINGTVEDVNKMILNMPVDIQTVRQLCTFTEILKKQTKRNEQKKEKVAEELRELRREVNKLTREKGMVEEQVQALSFSNTRLEEDLKYYKELSQKLQKADDTIDLSSPAPKKLKTSYSKLKEKKTDSVNERENDLSVIEINSPFHKSIPKKKSLFSLDAKVINKLDLKKTNSKDFDDDLEIVPSKTFSGPLSISNKTGIFRKELPMVKSSSSIFPASSNFIPDGMGGSKRPNLATSTPREEFEAIRLNKEAARKKTDVVKQRPPPLPLNGCKKINSYFRDSS